MINAEQFLDLPPIQWQEAIAALKPEQRRELENHITDIAQRAVLAAGYLNAQHNQIDHDRGVVKSSRFVTAFRKSVGFAYPKADYSY